MPFTSTISPGSPISSSTDDLQGEKQFNALHAFGASKTCNLIFTFELARRLAGTSVTALAIHPGLVKSQLMREAAAPIRWIMSLISRAPEQAAETLVHYASSPDVADLSGRFVKGRKTIEASPYAQDQAVQKRLWEVSMALTLR